MVVVTVALMLCTASAMADPGLGLDIEWDGKNFIHKNPMVTKLRQYKGLVKKPQPPVDLPVRNPLPAPDGLENYEATETNRVTSQLKPSVAAVRKYVAATGTLETVLEEPAGTLTDEAWNAVELAPDWLKVELTAKFARLEAWLQDDYAELMTTAENPLFLDEIAFMIAHTTVYDLTHEYIRPRYLADQAKYLYMAAPLLDYVTLKEYGNPEDGGDFWTTTVYKYTKEGEELEWELPREDYYWWVVHTRLDGEPLHDIRPDTGKFSGYPLGVTYREYYMFPPEDDTAYMTHYIMKDVPPYEKYKGMKDITIDELQGWGPSQKGAFADLVLGPSYLTMDSQGRTTTMEFKIRHKGVVLATTMMVEEAYANGKSDLLQTMLRYGPGNVVMNPEFKHLVIMENNAPFGHEGVIEGVLDKFDVNYEVITAAELAEYDMTDVRKVIVPSDQPIEVYTAVSENTEKLREWCKSNWNIIEFHGAVSTAEQDWSGLIMFDVFTGEGVADEEDDFVEVEGQPPLAKYILDTKYLWDFEKYPGLSGDRICDPDTFALDKIGYWASQNIWDSVGDWAEKHPWFFPERSVQAVRVAYNHYGNCGENQDIITAGSRAVLVPTSNTSNGCEDHVWSEWLIEDEWHTFQMGWADANTDIDHPGISSGKKWGGGKNISFVTQTRGDGKLNNRTDYYHYTGKLHVTVVDADGVPIQGAYVLVATETYYKDNGAYPFTFAFWDVTDTEGNVTLELGANIEEDLPKNCADQEKEYRCNSYRLKVVTYAGNYPPEDNTAVEVVTHVEAHKDFEKSVTIEIPGSVPVRRPLEVDGDVETAPQRVIRVSADQLQEMKCGLSLYASKFCHRFGDGILDFYVLDEENFEKYAADEPFDAIHAEEGLAEGFEFAALAPTDGDWYLVLAHQNRYQHEQLLDGYFQVLDRTAPMPVDDPVAPVEESVQDVVQPSYDVVSDDSVSPAAGDGGPTEEPKKKKDDGCTSHPASVPGGGGILLLLLGLGLALLRRRPQPSS